MERSVKNIIRKTGVALIVILCAYGFLCMQSASREDPEGFITGHIENHPYISPTPGEITIVASSPWVTANPVSQKQLQDIRDCGFNTVLSLTDVKQFRRVAPMLEKAGLKAIVGFGDFTNERGKALIDTMRHNPVIGGWRLSDEPKEVDFAGLQKWYDNICAADPDHMCYVNMVGPEGGKRFFGDCPDYVAFLSKFQEMFHPSVWSYDLYPIYEKGGRLYVNYDQFYESLEIFSHISEVTRRPFWAYCQSMAFTNGTITKPAANLGYLSFEAMSALGYGAKGLVYWTYCLRKSGDKERYLSALVDLDYKKSPAWYAARQLNGEIKALESFLLNAKYIGTRHTGQNIPAAWIPLSGA